MMKASWSLPGSSSCCVQLFPEEALAKRTVKEIAKKNGWYVFTSGVSYSRSYPKAHERSADFSDLVPPLEPSQDIPTVRRGICQEGWLVSITNSFALLEDLARLVRKYGPEVFSDLSALLRDPRKMEDLTTILEAGAQQVEEQRCTEPALILSEDNPLREPGASDFADRDNRSREGGPDIEILRRPFG